jgi:hypothetical protein
MGDLRIVSGMYQTMDIPHSRVECNPFVICASFCRYGGILILVSLNNPISLEETMMKKLLLAGVASAAVNNIVLVHGAYADGSCWND